MIEIEYIQIGNGSNIKNENFQGSLDFSKFISKTSLLLWKNFVILLFIKEVKMY